MCCVTAAAACAQSNLRFVGEANGNVSRAAADNFPESSGEGYNRTSTRTRTSTSNESSQARNQHHGQLGAFRGNPGSDRESPAK